MQVSDLIEALQKVRQVAGDIPVLIHHLEDDATTELKSIGVHIDPTAGAAGGSVELEHAAPTEAEKPTTAPAAEADPPQTQPRAGS